jgi:ubiquinone/menaquinone biosynthesis C-methylase UbiE
MQENHPQWAWQWDKIQDHNQWLFTEWIFPNTLEDFRGKEVLDCGCGGGNQLTYIAPYCTHAVGVDMNTTEVARQRVKELHTVSLVAADIASMNLNREFDIVYSIGVLHHTDDPTASFKNIVRHCKPGGRVIVWVYSHEGNALNRWLVEPSKNVLIHFLPRPIVWGIAHLLTVLVSIPVFTIYLLVPRSLGEVGLPYYQYFQNWRQLSYKRNLLNVFDKLNAPQTHFLQKETLEEWFNEAEFTNIHISPYKNVSWRGSGTKRG